MAKKKIDDEQKIRENSDSALLEETSGEEILLEESTDSEVMLEESADDMLLEEKDSSESLLEEARENAEEAKLKADAERLRKEKEEFERKKKAEEERLRKEREEIERRRAEEGSGKAENAKRKTELKYDDVFGIVIGIGAGLYLLYSIIINLLHPQMPFLGNIIWSLVPIVGYCVVYWNILMVISYFFREKKVVFILSIVLALIVFVVSNIWMSSWRYKLGADEDVRTDMLTGILMAVLGLLLFFINSVSGIEEHWESLDKD